FQTNNLMQLVRLHRDFSTWVDVAKRLAEGEEIAAVGGELKWRSAIKIGLAVLVLEKAKHGPGRGKKSLSADGKPFPSKARELAKAGLSTTTAWRWCELAGGSDPKRQAVHSRAATEYFEMCRREPRRVPDEGSLQA